MKDNAHHLVLHAICSAALACRTKVRGVTAVIEQSALPKTAVSDEAAAAQEWALTATTVGGSGIARQESRRAHRVVYEPRDSRPITATLPKRAAAVMLYDNTQRLHCLAFDLDAKSGYSPEQVRAESVDLAHLLRSCGFVAWIDESPSGGRHVYAPLATPVAFLELRPYLAGLRKRFPTLDITPLANRTAGCIRPTGSPHPQGGYQRLVTPIEQVRADLATGSHRDAWMRLKFVVPAEEQTAQQPVLDVTDTVVDLRGRRLPAWAESLATSGDQTARYRSDSHTRMAVAGAAAYAGWNNADYVRAINTRWPWLRASYTAKGRSLANAAVYDLEKAHSNAPGKKPDRQSDTSHETRTRAGGSRPTESTNKQIRRWLTHATRLGRTHPHKSYSAAKQALVRAVGVMALLQDREWINAGTRAYGLQAGIHQGTVARMLHELADDGLIWKAKDHRGIHADVWVLNLAQARTATPWRGKVHGTRAVFRVLGGWQVAEVYEELVKRRGTPARAAEIATTLARAKSTVDEALGALAAYKLADGTAGWVVGPADPHTVAVQLGADELEANQIATYKAQRAKWRAYLAGLPRIRKHEDATQREAAQEVMWAAEWEMVEPPEPPWLDVIDIPPNRRRRLRDLA